MAISPLFNQPSHIPINSTFNQTTAISNTSYRRKSFISKSKLELEEAIRSLEEETITTIISKDQQAIYNRLISSCIQHKALSHGNRLRAHIAQARFEPSLFLNNQFINLYSRCGDLGKARQVFDQMPERNIVSWNAMIAGYCHNAQFFDALSLLQTMVEDGVVPDYLTYLSALRASASSGVLRHGEQVHARIIKDGFFLSRIEVGNALINFYSKLGVLHDAESVFDTMMSRDEVTWNSLIAGNSQKGNCKRAVALLVEMLEEGELPDEFTYGSLLALEDTSYTEKLHSQIIKKGLASNVFASSALLDAYGRCGKPQDARKVFNSMIERNTTSWNSVISACIVNGAITEGIQLFFEMQKSEVIPDDYTISTLLKAAMTHLSTFTAKQLHGVAYKMGLWRDASIGNTLIILYAKLGLMKDSLHAFEDISEPDLISWNSRVQAHLNNEEFEQALILFIEMKHLGFVPDKFSFVAAMEASAALPCCKTGRQIHCNLIKAGLLPLDAFTGSSLIDMYAKSMAVEDAKKVFDRINIKDLITWNSIVVGFAQNGYLNEVLKFITLMKQESNEPDNFTFASILTACANATAIEQGKQVHALILKSNFKVDTALTNALITMYCRAGSIKDAKKVFSSIHEKNVVSWTSMISGYTQCGYSCSHGGLSNDAIKYFEIMQMRHGIKPTFDHYACMVDILGRAGRLEEAERIIEGMPYKPNALVWRMLLSACRIHGDLERGKKSMEKILTLEPDDSAAFVLLSNLYTDLGFHEGAMKIRKLMREKGIKKEPGKSWIEVNNRVYEFMAGDISHSQTEEIYSKLKQLLKPLRDEGYVPGNSFLR
ncbi:hypothetical protein M5K25_000665 [Dendrobium thyrsiflorum]|uniref:Pentatricopeptide repeat-containing protein n=1 Tax=Dendrobium thyrsiflorum TaxID=117978 RepID=A0ABD0W7Y7_DENTH